MKRLFEYVPPDTNTFTPMPVEQEQAQDDVPKMASSKLNLNVDALCGMLHTPPNEDVSIRYFHVGGRDAAIINMEGMVSRDANSGFILRPLLLDERLADISDRKLVEFISKETLSAVTLLHFDDLSQVYKGILNGLCALLINGCPTVICVDIREYEKRNVEKPQIENVILGPHEGFTENLRTSITQVRRMLRTGKLVTEFFNVGNEASTSVALLYLEDITNPELVEEGRRRLRAVNYDFVPGSGYLQHLIEDSTNALVPQMTQTERPDRTAFFLMEGHIAILCESSPFALCAPATVWHLMHAPDDTFMRWPSGTFTRVIRFGGLFLSILLPALYIATILFHSEFLPIEMLVSIASSNAPVPFPMLIEVLVMELSFDLIHEAGTRTPGTLGSALGIIGAIILGQAAVAAQIVSPILIIIVALTGLGNFAIPDYSFSVSMRLLRLVLMLAGALLGYMGISAAMFVIMAFASTLTSFGVPWLSPFAPKSTANPDLIRRSPLWDMRRRPSFLRTRDQSRAQGRVRGWDRPGRKP